MTKQTAVSVIGEYAAARRYQDLSELTITRARQVVLDFIGTMLGGYQTELGQLASDYAAQMLPGDDASIVGDGRRSTTEGAAWANAVMGKFLGMDDSHSTAAMSRHSWRRPRWRWAKNSSSTGSKSSPRSPSATTSWT